LGVVTVLGSITAASTMNPARAAAVNVKLRLAQNVAAVPNFDSSGYSRTSATGISSFPNPCVGVTRSGRAFFVMNSRGVACTLYVLGAINRAHQREGLAPMVLPTNWYRLSTAQQLFVVADLERVARGLPPYLGLNAALSVSAERAAKTARDPGVAPGFAMSAMGSTWASAGTVLEADYVWMYSDGWGGTVAKTSNHDCTSAGARGCWGHREVLLGHYTGLGCTACELGTGFAILNGSNSSYADLLESPAGAPPAMSFTWAKDVQPFLLRGGTTSASATTSSVAVSSTTTLVANP
jgi:hypothetical protein